MSSEVIGRLIADFNNLNEKCVHLVEENQNLKQQNQNLQQENQILKEKLQEKDKQLEKLQERDKQYEKLEQHVKNLEKQKSEELQQLRQLEIISQNLHNNLGILEKQKSEELQQLRQLEIISQNLHNNLGILGSDKTKKNDIKITEERNKFLTFLTNKNEQTNQYLATLSLDNKDANNSSEYFLNFFDTSLEKDTEKSKLYPDIQVVVGIDFGAISSAFSVYCVTTKKPKKSSNYTWDLRNTILKYNNKYSDVMGWNGISKYIYNVVELFKLHLGGLPDNLKPKLQVEYKKAIADYLKEIGKDIKNEIAISWTGVNYFENVLLVLTIPADYSEKDKDIMRECTHNAKLVKNKSSEKLQFITESEAVAIYCMKNELQKYNLLSIRKTFIIIDCGGSTTDITTHKLVENNPLQLSEVTELIRDYCGCTFIDEEFIKLLNEKFETRTMNLIKKNHYGPFRNTVYEFFQHVMELFTGDNMEFYYTLDVEEKIPELLQHVSKEIKEIMEADNWLIDIKYNEIKKMVDH
ncbi:hypothetical protein RhiirA4_475494, partial [Rhizophagus irregularis]